jgi:hypothetical protein
MSWLPNKSTQAPPPSGTPAACTNLLPSLFYKRPCLAQTCSLLAPSFPGQQGTSCLSLNPALGCEIFSWAFFMSSIFPNIHEPGNILNERSQSQKITLLYDSIYVKCPNWENFWNKKINKPYWWGDGESCWKVGSDY